MSKTSMDSSTGKHKKGQLWNRFLAEAQRNSSGMTKTTHCVLVVSDSETLQREFITRLEQSLKVKDTRYFSSQDSQSRNDVIIDGFGLGYTYIEVQVAQEAEREILEIYTLTYTQAEKFQRDLLFVERFRGKNKFTVVDLVDLEQTIAAHGELSLRRIFEERATVCLWLGRALGSKTTQMQDSFARAKGQFYVIVSHKGAPVEDVVELGPGECDSPVGCEYCLVVVGTETLAGGMVSQLEVDKLQQYLRVLALKCGGSVFYFTSLLQDLTHLSRQILQSQRVSADVDDTLSIRVPKGWDTRAKIKVVNEYCEMDSLEATWVELWRKVLALDVDIEKASDHVSSHVTAPGEAHFEQYQDFLRHTYKAQLELELRESATPIKAEISPVKEVMENTTVLGGDDADISTSFHETHSMLQEFRLQFLDNDADLLAGIQSTPGQPRVSDSVPMAAPRFLEF